MRRHGRPYRTRRDDGHGTLRPQDPGRHRDRAPHVGQVASAASIRGAAEPLESGRAREERRRRLDPQAQRPGPRQVRARAVVQDRRERERGLRLRRAVPERFRWRDQGLFW